MIHIAAGLHDPSGSYSKNLGACLCSVFANTASPITVHVLYTRGLTYENRQKFEALAHAFGHTIDFIDINEMVVPFIAQQPRLACFSPASLSRLFLVELLPDVARIICLDADMIVDMDILDVWNVDLQGHPLGAVPDVGVQRAKTLVSFDSQCEQWAQSAFAHWDMLGIKHDAYFNAGLLLLDMDSIRAQRLLTQVLDFLQASPDLPIPDQDALNAVFHDIYLPLPFRFNVMLSLYPTWETVPCIWHFTGLKPWNAQSTAKQERYFEYLKMTPWGNEAQQSEYVVSHTFCPLCSSGESLVLETIDIQDLAQLYASEHEYRITDLAKGVSKIEYRVCSRCDLRFFTPPVLGDQHFYNHLSSRYVWYNQDNKWEFSVVKQHIATGAKVLEIGCGKGAFARLLDQVEYVGLELTPEKLPQSTENAVYLLESIEQHSENNKEKYDVVCAFQTLEYVSNIQSFISAAYAVLKPGGLFFISVPTIESYYKFVVNHALNMPPHHQTHWSDTSLSAIAQLYAMTLLGTAHEPLLALDEACQYILMAIYRAELGLSPNAILDISTVQQSICKKIQCNFSQVQPVLKTLVESQNGAGVIAVYRK